MLIYTSVASRLILQLEKQNDGFFETIRKFGVLIRCITKELLASTKRNQIPIIIKTTILDDALNFTLI